MKNGPRPGSALGGPRSALGGDAWREEDVAHVIEGAPVGVVGVSRADGPLRTSGKPAASRRPATLSSPTTTASCSCRPGRPARCWPPRARSVRSSGARLAGSGKARRCASRPPSMITWPGAPLTRPAPSGSTCAAPAEPSKNRSPRVPGLPAGRKNNPATVPAKKTTVSPNIRLSSVIKRSRWRGTYKPFGSACGGRCSCPASQAGHRRGSKRRALVTGSLEHGNIPCMEYPVDVILAWWTSTGQRTSDGG